MLVDLRLQIVYLALVCGLLGLFVINKLPNLKAKSTLFSIWFCFLIEFMGIHFKDWTGLVNFPIFNLYILIIFLYYLVLLRLLLKKIVNQILATFSLFIFVGFYFIDAIFIQNSIVALYTNSYAVGVVVFLFISCLYLFEIFNSVQILNFKKSIYFWFILGALLFHISFLPYLLAINLFLLKNVESIFNIVLFVLNLLMYSCFAIGFIWSEKKYNY